MSRIALGGASGIRHRPGWTLRWLGVRAHLGFSRAPSLGRRALRAETAEASWDHVVQCLECLAKDLGLYFLKNGDLEGFLTGQV